MIIQLSITIFLTQLVFIGCRTWNVKAVAKNNLRDVLLSGAIVHMAWLVSIAIGSVSMNEVITNFKWEYLPIILCSLTGGLIGSWIGLREKQSKSSNK